MSIKAAEVQLAPPAARDAARSLIDRSAPRRPSVCNASADWLQVSTPDPSHPMSDGLFCSLRAVEQNGGNHTEVYFDIFDACLQGNCVCNYYVAGAIAQLKPCRMYAEAICRGDEDPDWDYMLHDCFWGFRVIDPDCVSFISKQITPRSPRVTLVRR